MGESTLAAARRAKALNLAGSLASAWPSAPKPRRKREPRATATVIDYRKCSVCSALFIGRAPDSGHRKTCSSPCATEHRRRIGNARKRNRQHLERSAYSDITPQQEMAMRRKARKCPMPGCGVKLTDEPGLPNSKHLDHIIPIAAGGTHSHGNTRVICRSCNVRRPRDGSDYFGPVTLWAVLPGTVARPHGGTNKTTCRKGLHPWVAENIGTGSTGKNYCRACRQEIERARNPLRPCARCGTPAALQGGQAMCPACTDTAARKAAELHKAGGLNWNQVAALVGYGSGEGARYAAKRIGYTAAPNTPALKPRPLCQCGEPVPPGQRGPNHSRCDRCVLACAQRAVRLRQEGWTLRRIADEMGYSSITTITNLMKTVAPVASQMGRPRKTA
jgi:hypothetical protein